MIRENTLKERLGMALERWLYAILRVLFPSRLGFRILHPDWNNYNNHNGVDFRVFDHNKEILAVECKNWRKLGKKYGLGVAQTEIVERFNHIGTSLKVVLISFLDVLTNPSIQQIKSNGIHLIETNKLVGHNDYHSQLFHVVKSAIQNLIKQHQKPQATSIQSNTVPISYYCSSMSYVEVDKTIPTIEESSDRAILEELDRPVKPLYVMWLRYKCDMEEDV